MTTITVSLCRDCVDAAAEYEYATVPGTVLPGIDGGEVTVTLEFIDDDPHFSSHRNSCDGNSDNCQLLAGDRWDLLATIDRARKCRECDTTTCSRRPGWPYCYGTVRDTVSQERN